MGLKKISTTGVNMTLSQMMSLTAAGLCRGVSHQGLICIHMETHLLSAPSRDIFVLTKSTENSQFTFVN